MGSDDTFRMMFYEEARELLIALEEGLVELERKKEDRAHLDRTFRAAHSIKGAAAMVGLPSIAEFTHGIEAVLDAIRSKTLPIDSDIITTLLEARDHLAAMVEADAAGAPIPPSTELSQRLLSLIRNVSANGGKGSVPPPASPPPPPAQAVAPPLPAPPPPEAEVEAKTKPKPKPRTRKPKADTKRTDSSKPADAQSSRAPSVEGLAEPLDHLDVEAGKGFYRITLKPGPDVLKRGVNPLGVLDELRELGRTHVSTDPALVPALEDLDPERCYLVWTIEVETDVPVERLDDVFLFVADDSKVTIERREGTRGAFQSIPLPANLSAFPVTALPIPKDKEPEKTAVNGESPAPPGPVPLKLVSAEERSIPTTSAVVSPAVLPIPKPLVAAEPRVAATRVAPRIRVDATQLDDLVGLAGELAVLSDNLQGLRDITGATPWIHTLEALERVSRQIRDTTLDLRMVPVDELFSRFPRVIRDLADKFHKEIDLRIVGQDTRLDRTIVERLSEPMIHLIRNAVDHALESPEERTTNGKSRQGRITLSAGHEGDRVSIRVEDDGRGLDRERILRRGLSLGLVPPGTAIDDPRIDTLIFEPGFSTRDAVSELSGRGVGLDVVRDAVRGLRGSLAVESRAGKGTAFIFRLPLTLALIDGLLVETAGSRYVVPLAQVEECVALSGSKPALSRGRPCVAVRGELVPMVPLRRLFKIEGDPPARQELLLTRHAGQRVGVTVDKLLGRVQAVIQALGEGLVGLNRFSGATILGDGSVSLILDLTALVTESRAADQYTAPHAGVRAEGF